MPDTGMRAFTPVSAGSVTGPARLKRTVVERGWAEADAARASGMGFESSAHRAPVATSATSVSSRYSLRVMSLLSCDSTGAGRSRVPATAPAPPPDGGLGHTLVGGQEPHQQQPLQLAYTVTVGRVLLWCPPAPRGPV